MIFDGRAFAKEIEEQVKLQVAELAKKPKIVSILIGNDPASELYTRLKKNAAERVGITFHVVRLPAGCLKQEISDTVLRNAKDESVTGIMIQLPIPGLTDPETNVILSEIPVNKDVDGLIWEQSGVQPATVRAVLSILNSIGKDLKQLRVVVLGAGGAVGRPLVTYLRARGVMVQEVGRQTVDPEKIVREGDIVISSVGKAGLVVGEMVRVGVVAVDVGMSEVAGKVVGDMTQ